MKLQEPLPNSIATWLEFMNGYRDPKTVAEMRADQDFKDSWQPDSSGSGERECGSRKEGGTYATCPLSPYGMPLEHFISCKPVPIIADDYNLSNIGVKLVDIEEVCLECKGVTPEKKKKAKYTTPCPACDGTGTETVTHVFDIVGGEYYPNVADFLEEARRMGVSRRLELDNNLQYARLTKRSRLMLLHRRAVINNPLDLFKGLEYTEALRLFRAGCPKGLIEHAPAESNTPYPAVLVKTSRPPGCAALYWHVIEGGEEIPETLPILIAGQSRKGLDRMPEIPSNRFVNRKLAAGTYRGYALPEGVTPEYALGIFAVFPIVKIDVVDPEGIYDDRTIRAAHSFLDVEAVEC